MSVCSEPIPPEQIQRGVDTLLDRLREELASQQLPPLDEGERWRARADLVRAPVVADTVGPICIRGRLYNQGLLTDLGALEYLTLALGWRRMELTGAPVFPITVVRSYAGHLYLGVIDLLYHEEAADEDEGDELRRGLLEYVRPEIWERDDVPAMQRIVADILDYIHYVEQPDRFRRAGVELGRLLHEPDHPRHRPELTKRIHLLQLDWRHHLHFGVETNLQRLSPPDATVEQIVDRGLALVERIVDETEERRFGEGSRAAREAVDRAERLQGRLSANCDFWTYEELEHWARWWIESSTVPQLCAIVLQQKRLLEFIGTVELDAPCEQIEKIELVTLLTEAVRRATKRHLCTLLQQTTPPPIVRWNSQRWYNVESLSDYLPVETVASILVESKEEKDTLFFVQKEDGPLLAGKFIGTAMYRLTELNRASYNAGLDLYNRMLTPVFDDEEEDDFRLDMGIDRLRLSVADPPRLIASQYYYSTAYPAANWVAVVVLRGLLLVSLITTTQVATRATTGEMEVEERRESHAVLSPQRLALMPGDALIATLGESYGKISRTPFDSRGFYDTLVLRAGEDGTEWLEYTF